MDTQNPVQNSKKGKKGLWIKIVAAVVVVGAIVTVGVLGMQGDWLQGRTKLGMVTQPKVTTKVNTPVVTTQTKVTPQAVTDLCTNIPGVQTTIPAGYIANEKNCTPIPVCGDGFKKTDGSESCDDLNTANGDGCSATCQIEPGWTCPDSPFDAPSQCPIGTPQCVNPNPSHCYKITCGDGYKEGGEACDDKNNTSGDGCSAACQVETGATCNAQESLSATGRGLQSICVPAEPEIEDPFANVPPPVLISITSDPAANQNNELEIYPLSSIAFTHSDLPPNTTFIFADWNYNESVFQCSSASGSAYQRGTEAKTIICSPKDESGTGNIYNGFTFSWCITNTICSQSNSIHVRVLSAGGTLPASSAGASSGATSSATQLQTAQPSL